MKTSDGKSATMKEQGFYHTRAWRKLRVEVLQRDHYLCQLRCSEKCTRIATTVHHIKELEDYPELALDPSNLVSCCYWCHEQTKEKKENTEALDRALSCGVRVIRVK